MLQINSIYTAFTGTGTVEDGPYVFDIEKRRILYSFVHSFFLFFFFSAPFISKNLHIYKTKKEDANMVDFNKDNWQQEFNEDQLKMIKRGIEGGLTKEQINLYAVPEFDHDQMDEILIGIRNNKLSLEQIRLFADPKFDWQQMSTIREGFCVGLTTEQVSLYAKPEFNVSFYDDKNERQLEPSGTMLVIKDSLLELMPLEQIKVFAKPEFSENQMYEIKKGFIDGLSIEQVLIYADPEFEDSSMEFLHKDLEEGTISLDAIKLYAKPEFYAYFDYDKELYYGTMCEIKKGIINGLTKEQVALYADKKFNVNEMRQIRKGLEAGLTEDEIKFFADPRYNDHQMKEICTGFINGLTLDQIKFYADGDKYEDYQMKVIREGFESGLAKEQATLYADPEFDANQMAEIRCGLEAGLTEDEVKTFAFSEMSAEQMHEIRTGFPNGISKREINNFEYYHEVKTRREKPVSFDGENAWRKGFSYPQTKEILAGENLSREQVGLYAKPEYDRDQMREIRRGFENKLSMEQIALYADPKFNWGADGRNP